MTEATRESAASPVVDVVLPAHNGSTVIRKAIESALAQDVPLRVIVVDDGSTDDSAAIARSYGSRVSVIQQENRGVSGARNTALAAASAPYVALLDQDDIWQPGKLLRQIRLMEGHPNVGLVFTDMVLLESSGRIVENGFLLTTPPYARLDRRSLGDGAYLLSEDLAQAVVRFNFISPSTVLLRRTAIQDVGGFDEAFRLCDDAECWMRLLARWRGIAIEDRLVLSLVWEGNASLTKADKLIWERIRIGEKVEAHPALFPPGTVEHFRRERPISHYRLGVIGIEAGEIQQARRHFVASLRDRWSIASAVALASTLLPSWFRNVLLQAKRALGFKLAIRIDH